MTTPDTGASGAPHVPQPDGPTGLNATAAEIEDVEIFSDDVETWLARQYRVKPASSLYWAPCEWRYAADWVEVRCVEHLAVLISTAIRSDNNVCFASSTRGTQGRSANVIGLIDRPVTGWAVVVNGGYARSADVQRIGYRYNNYDSFGALLAAEICAAWVVTGCLPEGLEPRLRAR